MIYDFFRYFDISILIVFGLLFPFYVCNRWCIND